METLDYDYTVHMAKNREADKGLAVRFFSMPVQDMEASDTEARPIFRDVHMVEIRVRGSRNDIVHQPVDEVVKRRFPDQWRNYEQGLEMLDSGTPLEQWSQMSRAQVEEMRYFGFRTVEHLADARDDMVSKFPGLMGLKQKAIAFLEFSKGLSPVADLQKQLKDAQDKAAAAEHQLTDLSKRMEAMEKGAPKGEPAPVAAKSK